MKTIVKKSLLLALGTWIMSYTTLAAAPGSEVFATTELVKKEIVKKLEVPPFITENSNDNKVVARLLVDETGRISVKEINSADERLKNYVVQQLNTMRLGKAGEAEEFVLIIRFKIA